MSEALLNEFPDTVWHWLAIAADQNPACADRVAALVALKETEPERAEEEANACLTALWAAL